MATLNTQGISLYYEVYGDPANPPVLLLSGLGGSGKSWNTLIDRFATDYYVVVPDHRGTGQSTHAEGGHTTTQLATDMASLVEHLALGPMRIDMIVAHDTLPRLGEVRLPTLVVCGDQDFCTPLPLSQEIAHAIPGSEFVAVPDCGHLIENEKEDEFFQIVSSFIGHHR